jgi:hypothetical protein
VDYVRGLWLLLRVLVLPGWVYVAPQLLILQLLALLADKRLLTDGVWW